VLQTINNGKLYYCGVFHPDADKQNVLMAGCADKKIYQFDMDTGDAVQVGGAEGEVEVHSGGQHS
jgi:pre-mRNA-processing factor 17